MIPSLVRQCSNYIPTIQSATYLQSSIPQCAPAAIALSSLQQKRVQHHKDKSSAAHIVSPHSHFRRSTQLTSDSHKSQHVARPVERLPAILPPTHRAHDANCAPHRRRPIISGRSVEDQQVRAAIHVLEAEGQALRQREGDAGLVAGAVRGDGRDTSGALREGVARVDEDAAVSREVAQRGEVGGLVDGGDMPEDVRVGAEGAEAVVEAAVDGRVGRAPAGFDFHGAGEHEGGAGDGGVPV